MKEWWFGLQAGERRTLTVGGVALTLITLYFGGWVSLQDGVSNLETQVQAQRDLKHWMAQSAAEVNQLRHGGGGQGQTTGQSLLSLVDQTARSSVIGSSLKRVEPEGEGSVKVWLEQAAFDDMISWLVALEQQHGLSVATITIERQAVGRVDANMTLRGAAGP